MSNSPQPEPSAPLAHTPPQQPSPTYPSPQPQTPQTPWHTTIHRHPQHRLANLNRRQPIIDRPPNMNPELHPPDQRKQHAVFNMWNLLSQSNDFTYSLLRSKITTSCITSCIVGEIPGVTPRKIFSKTASDLLSIYVISSVSRR